MVKYRCQGNRLSTLFMRDKTNTLPEWTNQRYIGGNKNMKVVSEDM